MPIVFIVGRTWQPIRKVCAFHPFLLAASSVVFDCFLFVQREIKNQTLLVEFDWNTRLNGHQTIFVFCCLYENFRLYCNCRLLQSYPLPIVITLSCHHHKQRQQNCYRCRRRHHVPLLLNHDYHHCRVYQLSDLPY